MGRMPASAALLLLGACTLFLCSSVHAQDSKFEYNFSRGDMVCKNLASYVTCTNLPPYAMNTAGQPTPTHRNIISADSNGFYALGFEKATSGSFYLSIYKFNPGDLSASPSIWRAKSASGADAKIDENGTLTFLKSGALELRNSKGSLVWTTGTKGATDLEFFYSSNLNSLAGNLILYNSGRGTVYQTTTVNGNKFLLDLQQLPTIVCTNEATGVKCTNPPPYAMNTAGYNDDHRNIICMDTDGLYALGFEKSRGGFHLSIYIWNPSTRAAGPLIWRAKALRGSDILVDEKATVNFLQNGSIELKNSAGKMVWSTGTKNAGVTDLEFGLDSGNMILYNAKDTAVWQSAGN